MMTMTRAKMHDPVHIHDPPCHMMPSVVKLHLVDVDIDFDCDKNVNDDDAQSPSHPFL
jgi:hypothetical protein